METILQSPSHGEHDRKWSLYCDQQKRSVCFGCVVECLEVPDTLTVQKKPALLKLQLLITHNSKELLELFMQEEEVVWHLVTLLTGLLKVEEEAFQSTVIEVLMKTIQHVGSEDLVDFVVDIITQEVKSGCSHEELLPHYTLLGKLVYQLPQLASKLLTEHEFLLDQISRGLTAANENVQSAVTYIFVFVCDEQNETLLPPRLRQHVFFGILQLLNKSQGQPLQINGLACCSLMLYNDEGLISILAMMKAKFYSYFLSKDVLLGLLKKILKNEESANILMTANLEGVTLLSVLKKLLLSKKEVLQIGVSQVLTLLLQKEMGTQYGVAILQSDMAEFLFESLHTQNTVQLESVLTTLCLLSNNDTFYKRCHAVYGIESILRSLTICFELKNSGLLKQGFTLLLQVLQRQPLDIPLFVSSSVVKSCLSTIRNGVEHHQFLVFSQAIMAAAAMCKKELLMLPIPFRELAETIYSVSSKVCSKLWEQPATSAGLQAARKGKGDNSQSMELLEMLIDVVLDASRVSVACVDKPATCESNFTAPGSTQSEQESTLESFIQGLLQITDETCLPLILMYWDKELGPTVYQKSLELLCSLLGLDSKLASDIYLRLTEAGFLVFVIDVKVTYRSESMLQRTADEFLLKACSVVVEEMGAGDECDLFQVLQDGIPCLYWKVCDLMQVCGENHLKKEALEVYVFILYLGCIQGNESMTSASLMGFLTEVLENQISLEEMSVSTRKSFIYLLAWCHVYYGMEMGSLSTHCVESIIRAVEASCMGAWSCDHMVLLQWCFSDVRLSHTCGEAMVETWLSHTSHTDLEDILGSSDDFEEGQNTVFKQQQLQHLSQNKFFIDSLLNLLTRTMHVTQAMLLLDLCLFTSRENKRSLEEASVCQSTDVNLICHVRQRTMELLQDLFLRASSHNKGDGIVDLLEVLMKANKFSGNQDPLDSKITYHVLKILSEVPSCPALERACLETLQCSVCTKDGDRVCQMIVQNEGVMQRLDTLLTDTEIPVFPVACDIVTELVNSSSITTSSQLPQIIQLDLLHFIDGMVSTSLESSLAIMKLITVLLKRQMEGSVVMLKRKITKDKYKTLFIYLQQLLLQEVDELKSASVTCLESLVHHLSTTEQTVVDELMSSSWNSLMLEILLDFTTTDPSLPVIKLVTLFVDHWKSSEEKMTPAQHSILCKVITHLLHPSWDCVSINLSAAVHKLIPQLLDVCGDLATKSEIASLEDIMSKTQAKID